MPAIGKTSEFWKKLTALPGYKGLTQTQIASKVTKVTGSKVGQTAVQKWKAGEAYPTTEKLIKIAAEQKTSLDALLPAEDGGPPADPLWIELAEVWKALKDPARQYLVGVAKYERSIQFTGDPEKRSRYQMDLQRLTKSQQALTESIDPNDK